MTDACAVQQALGGEVKAADGGGEYGRMAIRSTQASSLYSAETEHKQQVWMSHGDEAVRLPEGFTSVATSEQVSGQYPHKTGMRECTSQFHLAVR